MIITQQYLILSAAHTSHTVSRPLSPSSCITVILAITSAAGANAAAAAGPPDSLGELLTMLRIVRQQWPGATISTNSSFDDYLEHVITAVNNKQVKLPVVTGK